MQLTKRNYPDRTEIRNALQWMDGKIYIVNAHEEIEPENLLNIFEYAARRYGVKHFLVDSLMRVSFPMVDELKEHKNFVSSLLSFAKKYDCHVHLVAHPRKGAKENDKPSKDDIMGTGHITNLAHNVLIMWRPSPEDKDHAEMKKTSVADAVIYVKKNRELGLQGSVKLIFNPETKNFYEV